jgi:hypothetical protein
MRNALDVYMAVLPRNTFNHGQNHDKTFNQFLGNPQYRICHIEEPDDKKMDAETYKAWVDGEMQTNRLYKDGVSNVVSNALNITTTNTPMNIRADGGVKRRLKQYEHKSVFTDKQEDVNEARHIYLKDTSKLEGFITQNNRSNALVDILVQYALKWQLNKTEKKTYQWTTNFLEQIEEAMGSNDYTQQFIDECLDITFEMNDRITETEMMQLWNAHWKKHGVDRKRNNHQLLTDMKARIKHPDPDVNWKIFRTDLKSLGTNSQSKIRQYIGMSPNDSPKNQMEEMSNIEQIKYYRTKCAEYQTTIKQKEEYIQMYVKENAKLKRELSLLKTTS